MPDSDFLVCVQALRAMSASLKCEIAAQRVLLALRRLAALTGKANFNPDESRVPAGAPDGGQWTGGGASGSGFHIGHRFRDSATHPRIIRVVDSTPANRVNSPLKIWPVPGFGKLNPGNPATGEGNGRFGAARQGGGMHTGIDIQAPVGTPVVAAGDGTVVHTTPGNQYGNQVVINHGGGVFTQSAHLDTVAVKPGESVRAGQIIGTVGTTGNVPGGARSHVHFEVRIGKPIPHSFGGTVRNPFDYLPSPPTGP